LPAPPDDVAPWLRKVLDDAVDVSTLIHTTQFETAVSPLEATLAASLCVAFLRQMKVQSAAEERDFWRDALGIVAPHNAQGRLVTRALYDALTVPGARRTLLDDEALMASLRGTIYSVEKFQGSDRTLILGTVAISSRDQLASEEAFIYDLNRFNVLTSRARQKMVLLCAKSFLDYFPRDQDVSKHAARVRDFAYGFCDRAETVAAEGPNGAPVPLTWRYRL
jgi:DNA replication ATP-dependent helicase Dna2